MWVRLPPASGSVWVLQTRTAQTCVFGGREGRLLPIHWAIILAYRCSILHGSGSNHQLITVIPAFTEFMRWIWFFTKPEILQVQQLWDDSVKAELIRATGRVLEGAKCCWSKIIAAPGPSAGLTFGVWTKLWAQSNYGPSLWWCRRFRQHGLAELSPAHCLTSTNVLHIDWITWNSSALCKWTLC